MSEIPFQRAAFINLLSGVDREVLHQMQGALDGQLELHADKRREIMNAKNLIARITGETQDGIKFADPAGFASKADAEVHMVPLLNALMGKTDAPHNAYIRQAANTVRRDLEPEILDEPLAQLISACEEGGLDIRIGPNGAHVAHGARASDGRNGGKRWAGR